MLQKEINNVLIFITKNQNVIQKKILFLPLLFIVLFPSSSYTQTVNIVSEKAQVTLVVNQFAQIWETKNIDVLSKIMAHDPDMVNYGINSNLIFNGWNALKDSITKMWSVMENVKANVRNQVITIDPSGKVAWYSEICDMDLVYAGHPMQISNMRYTGVLQKRNDSWVIVQFHNSVTCE